MANILQSAFSNGFSSVKIFLFIIIEIFLNFGHNVPFDDKSPSVHVMAWQVTDNKLTNFTDTYMHHST